MTYAQSDLDAAEQRISDKAIAIAAGRTSPGMYIAAGVLTGLYLAAANPDLAAAVCADQAKEIAESNGLGVEAFERQMKEWAEPF